MQLDIQGKMSASDFQEQVVRLFKLVDQDAISQDRISRELIPTPRRSKSLPVKEPFERKPHGLIVAVDEAPSRPNQHDSVDTRLSAEISIEEPVGGLSKVVLKIFREDLQWCSEEGQQPPYLFHTQEGTHIQEGTMHRESRDLDLQSITVSISDSAVHISSLNEGSFWTQYSY
jgi:hypothetical protein